MQNNSIHQIFCAINQSVASLSSHVTCAKCGLRLNNRKAGPPHMTAAQLRQPSSAAVRGGEKGDDRHGLFQLVRRPDGLRARRRLRNLRCQRNAGKNRHAVANAKDAPVRDASAGAAPVLHHVAERPPLLL
jgi:hypothetical protein